MASVIFSADKDDGHVLDMLHLCVTQCIEKEEWRGIEKEVGRLRENGVRIGLVLIPPRGYHSSDLAFAFQCWDRCVVDLKKVARHFFDKKEFKKIRAVGLEQRKGVEECSIEM